MERSLRKVLQPMFDGLDPEAHGLTLFPPVGDEGTPTDDVDAAAAEIIYYGAGPDGRDRAIDFVRTFEFAIKLGRTLERNDL